jgi:hypothetical protein
MLQKLEPNEQPKFADSLELKRYELETNYCESREYLVGSVTVFNRSKQRSDGAFLDHHEGYCGSPFNVNYVMFAL